MYNKNNNTQNKKRALTGMCVKCGTSKNRFISNKIGGDVAVSQGKLPRAPWAKYPGEKHIP